MRCALLHVSILFCLRAAKARPRCLARRVLPNELYIVHQHRRCKCSQSCRTSRARDTGFFFRQGAEGWSHAIAAGTTHYNDQKSSCSAFPAGFSKPAAVRRSIAAARSPKTNARVPERTALRKKLEAGAVSSAGQLLVQPAIGNDCHHAKFLAFLIGIPSPAPWQPWTLPSSPCCCDGRASPASCVRASLRRSAARPAAAPGWRRCGAASRLSRR